ncbi:MAG: methyltransferase domain-containing protein [Bacteroidetes bacterium]|nr:MAG: methyltransferase domain-containing protein [Bacteroidota bacterium]
MVVSEKAYTQKVSLSHRKKYAQFFTPAEVADWMTDWISGHPNLKNVLEPAFGLGVFSRLLLKKCPNVFIKGFDVDPVILEEARQGFCGMSNVHLELKDYLFADWDNKYDGIVCNPPYFKFHDYENKKALAEIKRWLKVRANGFTNIYALFLLKAVYQLNEGGRAAFLIPSEFLNADYGRQIKDYLIRSGTLRHVVIFDFKETVFDDVLTTSAVLLLSKEANVSGVRFSTIHNKNQFESLRHGITSNETMLPSSVFALNALDPDIKWRAYYQEQAGRQYKNLIPFNKVAKVVRGIATGANDYFVFNKEKALKYGIPPEYLLPYFNAFSLLKTK